MDAIFIVNEAYAYHQIPLRGLYELPKTCMAKNP